jgi:hypothetical protein
MPELVHKKITLISDGKNKKKIFTLDINNIKDIRMTYLIDKINKTPVMLCTTSDPTKIQELTQKMMELIDDPNYNKIIIEPFTTYNTNIMIGQRRDTYRPMKYFPAIDFDLVNIRQNNKNFMELKDACKVIMNYKK